MFTVLHAGASVMSQKFVADVGGTNIRVAELTESGVLKDKKYSLKHFRPE